MGGSIGFYELQNMPLNQYLILKRAVEIESLSERINKVYDLNRSFHDAEPLFKQLKNEKEALLPKENSNSNNISWESNDNWQSKLNRSRI